MDNMDMYSSASCLNEIIDHCPGSRYIKCIYYIYCIYCGSAVSQFVARVTALLRLWCPALAVTRAAECDGWQHKDQWRVLAIVHSVGAGE